MPRGSTQQVTCGTEPCQEESDGASSIGFPGLPYKAPQNVRLKQQKGVLSALEAGVQDRAPPEGCRGESSPASASFWGFRQSLASVACSGIASDPVSITSQPPSLCVYLGVSRALCLCKITAHWV